METMVCGFRRISNSRLGEVPERDLEVDRREKMKLDLPIWTPAQVVNPTNEKPTVLTRILKSMSLNMMTTSTMKEVIADALPLLDSYSY